jgi:hypothetical protein
MAIGQTSRSKDAITLLRSNWKARSGNSRQSGTRVRRGKEATRNPSWMEKDRNVSNRIKLKSLAFLPDSGALVPAMSFFQLRVGRL